MYIQTKTNIWRIEVPTPCYDLAELGSMHFFVESEGVPTVEELKKTVEWLHQRDLSMPLYYSEWLDVLNTLNRMTSIFFLKDTTTCTSVPVDVEIDGRIRQGMFGIERVYCINKNQ